MDGLGPSTRDRIIPTNSNNDPRSWLDHFTVDPSRLGSSSDSFISRPGKADSYPYPVHDWMVSAKSEGSISVVERESSTPPLTVQLMATGGMAVFAGWDDRGMPVYRVDEPQTLPQLSPMAQAAIDPVRDKEQRLAKTGSQVQPGVAAGLLMVLGRFVVVPIERAIEALRRVMAPAWNFVEKNLIRALDWLDKQARIAEPYVTKSVKWIVSNVKKVLDFIIVTAPHAVIKGIANLWRRGD